LADVEVRQARHLGAEIKLIHLFFEAANFQHLAVEVKPALVFVGAGRWRLFDFRLGLRITGHDSP
jgi:hypothetical protein